MSRLGLALPVPGHTLPESVDLAEAAERLGYDDVWSSEVDGPDGLTPLAAVASRTTRLRLGVAVVPAATRPPALLAMSAASLRDLSENRFVLGIGASTPTVVENWMGADAGRPLARVRETIEAVRAAMSGQKVSFAGSTTSIDGFRLRMPPGDVPIYLGAMGPQMIALAGREADGLLLSFTAAEAVASIVGPFRAAAAKAGRDADRLDVVGRVPVAWGEDSPELRQQLRRLLAAYAVVPAYTAAFNRQGFEAQAAGAAAAWEDHDFPAAVAAIDETMLKGLCVFGPAGHCRERLQAYRESGVRTLVVSPVTGEPPNLGETLDRLAEIVASR